MNLLRIFSLSTLKLLLFLLAGIILGAYCARRFGWDDKIAAVLADQGEMGDIPRHDPTPPVKSDARSTSGSTADLSHSSQSPQTSVKPTSDLSHASDGK